MEENKFKCSGDCLNCRKLPNERREQWQYCAAQFTYNSMRMIEDLQKTIADMKVKIEAIQNNEASVFSTMEEKAQEGVGAVVEPQDSLT